MAQDRVADQHAGDVQRRVRPRRRARVTTNADPLMRALFIGHGPSFRAGATVSGVESVDVQPLLGPTFGLRTAADGDPQRSTRLDR
jgi:hypothetical protein